MSFASAILGSLADFEPRERAAIATPTDKVSAAWPPPSPAPLRCFVYGQGFCDSEKSYFDDFLKRADLAAWLTEELDVEALFPETEVRTRPGDPDFLREQMRLAHELRLDFIVALQPIDTFDGAPTLRNELQDLANDEELRTRTFLFRPRTPPDRFHTFDAIASRLLAAQVLEYSRDAYSACHDIRDLIRAVVDAVREAKGSGRWA